MKKWLSIIIIITLIVTAFLYHRHARLHRQEKVTTVAVTKGNITENAEAIGYIKPRHSIIVKSQVGGIVSKIYHYEGEPVHAGDLLMQVTPAPAPAEYASAVEALKEAKTNEQNAKADFNRYQDAVKQKLIATSYTSYIQAKKIYQSSQAQRLLAEQKLALLDKGRTNVAGKSIENTIKSPITGFILSRSVDVGDAVISLSSAQAATPLLSIANMNDLMFSGSVDETDASKINLKMPATITVGAEPAKKITGIVNRIALQSEQQAGTADTNTPFNVSFDIEITQLTFPKDLNLRAGYSATANIKLKTVNNVLMLPARVIHFDQNQPYVLLPQKLEMAPKRQDITIGISDGLNIEITQGLSLGQKVLDQSDDESDSDNK